MLLSRLKAETAPFHARIERDLGLAADLKSHIRQLEGFYGFLLPFEDQIYYHATAELKHHLTTRRKVPSLACDLSYWGYDSTRLKALPCCDALPPLDTPAQHLGSLYVIEGSTLGGQVISRHLEQTLGLFGGCGYSYFQGYGSRTVRMWQTFRGFLTDQALQVEEADIIEAACITFRQLHFWLCRRAEG